METILLLLLAFLAAASGCDLPLRWTEARLGAGATPGEAEYVERGLCPFECCVYREWTAAEMIAVHPTERDTAEIAFRIASGTSFRAMTGNVHVDGIGLVAVTDTVSGWRDPQDLEPGEPRVVVFQPGDTLEVLGYHGEGVHHVRLEGADWLVEEFWYDRPAFTGYDPRGSLLREPVTDWWVEIETADGRRGWVRMTPHTRVVGNDACG